MTMTMREKILKTLKFVEFSIEKKKSQTHTVRRLKRCEQKQSKYFSTFHRAKI